MAEKKVIELEVSSNLGNLKQQLKQAQVEVQNLADKFGATSDQAREAAKRAADLKDRIGDAKTLTDSFNPDAKFKGLAQALTGVTGGFAAVQGAMGLIGVESESVEKQLLKVQSAMALAAGIDQLTEAKEAFLNLGKTAVRAFNSIKVAIGSTGIGLIVISLGVIYTYWEDISKAIGFAGDETEKYAKQQKAIGEEAKKQREEIAKESGAFATLISRLKATNANTKEREELIKKINLQYGTTLKNIKDERNFQEQLNTELASYLEYQKAKYALQKNEDLIARNLAKQDELTKKLAKEQSFLNLMQSDYQKLLQRPEALVPQSVINSLDEQQKQVNKINKELQDAGKRFENYGSAANKAAIKVDILTKAGTKYVEQVKKDEPETTKAELDGIKTLNENIASLQEEARVSKLTDEQKEVDAINKKYTKLIEEGKKFKIDVTLLEEEKRLALAAITKKYDDLEQVAKDEKTAKEKEKIANEKAVLEELTKSEAELKLIKLDEEYKAQQLLYKDNKEILKALDEKYAKDKEVLDNEETEKKKETLQKQLDLVKDSFQAFADVATLFAGKNKKAQKTAFNIQKGANIAQTTIDTYTAAMAAYKSAVGIPYVGPFLAPIAAAGATAVGLLNIRKIAASKFEGGGTPSGGDGGGGATAPTMSAPQFNVVGQSGVNQLASLNQQPIQAYVVSGQVTSQQALDRNRLANATL